MSHPAKIALQNAVPQPPAVAAAAIRESGRLRRCDHGWTPSSYITPAERLAQ